MKKLLSTVALIGMVACAPAHAGSSIVWGKVVDVKPVHTQIHQSVPRDVCKHCLLYTSPSPRDRG